MPFHRARASSGEEVWDEGANTISDLGLADPQIPCQGSKAANSLECMVRRLTAREKRRVDLALEEVWLK